MVLRVDRGAVPAPQRRQDPERGRSTRTSAARREVSSGPRSHIPSRLGSRLASHESADYAWKLLAPFGLLSLAAPLLLLLGAPQAFLNLITNVPWTKTITFHYAALPFAAVDDRRGRGRRVRRPPDQVARRGGRPRRGRAGVLASRPRSRGGRRRSARSTATASGHSTRSPQLASARAAVAKVPDDSVVSATYNLVPHLTHRAEIYSFPNPWVSKNFGIDGEPRRSGKRVEWIVVDKRRARQGQPARCSSASSTRGTFRVVFDEGQLPRAPARETTEAIAVRRRPRSARGRRRFAGTGARRDRSRCS